MVASGQLSVDAADMLTEINQCISKGILKIDLTEKVRFTNTSLDDFARNEFYAAFTNAPAPSFIKKLQGKFLKTFLQITGERMLRKELNEY
jgi:hypothetical protein